MLVITSPAKVAQSLRNATALNVDAQKTQLFNQFGDARSTEFSRQFIKDNAQVLLSCNSTSKWYMRYDTAETADNAILFLAVTHKNKVSKGSIGSSRSTDDEPIIEEVGAVEEVILTEIA
ncbi:MAG: hypothetical protein IT273_10505 [Chitinophagales bacterium]|nr:hypothetical protein [Chitinophagales bacterium]